MTHKQTRRQFLLTAAAAAVGGVRFPKYDASGRPRRYVSGHNIQPRGRRKRHDHKDTLG